MARVWREGQSKPVFIYRFLTAGMIDEKIYQRQLTKIGISDQLFSENLSLSGSESFTPEDLKEIFTFVETSCK